MKRLLHPLLVAALVALPAGPLATARADSPVGFGHDGGGCCGHCGRCCRLKKVCRLVCEEREVRVDCWGCKRVDFCVPAPSQKCCTRCECVCGECNLPGDKRSCWDRVWALPKRFVYHIWKPCGACVRTKKVLMHRVEIKKIPVYRWEVEYLCPGCESCCQGAEFPAHGEPVPLPPDPDATLKFKAPLNNGPPLPHAPLPPRHVPGDERPPTRP